MAKESIIDTSKPNSGRIYDYLLGGHHNFEVDRQAAEQVIELLPFLPKALRLQRWCLQDIAQELTQVRGYNMVIDFASGLPTNDHIHYVVPEGTTVIYSDYDPVVVEYAHEILADTANVYFFLADARRPEELLNRPEVEQILGGKRNVALVYWGVSIFLTDEEMSHAARFLFEWTSDDACWAFNAQGAVEAPDDPAVAKMMDIYAQMGSPQYYRPLEKFMKLLQPWRADDPGFISLLDWHGFDASIMSKRDQEIWSSTSGMYGAYLIK